MYKDCITSQAFCGFSVKNWTLGRLFCEVHRFFLLAQQQYGPGVHGPYFGQHQEYIFLAWVVSFPITDHAIFSRELLLLLFLSINKLFLQIQPAIWKVESKNSQDYDQMTLITLGNKPSELSHHALHRGHFCSLAPTCARPKCGKCFCTETLAS